MVIPDGRLYADYGYNNPNYGFFILGIPLIEKEYIFVFINRNKLWRQSFI